MIQRNSQKGASVLGKGIGFIINIMIMVRDRLRVSVSVQD